MEIWAWSNLRREQLAPWEFDMIRLLDQTWLASYAKSQSKP